MLDFTIKSNKTCTKQIPCSSFTIPCERFRMNESTATPATAWEVNSSSLFLQIWQLREDTLNQRLGSFPTKSSAEILPRCRRDYPLLLAINRSWFDGQREVKIGSKVSQKTSLPPSSRCRFSSSAFSSFFLRHRKPTPSPFLPPAPPWATRTTKRCQDHRPATTASVISHRERLSLLCKTFLLPSLSTVAFGHHHSHPEHSSSTGSQHNHQPATKQPPRLSPSSLCNLSLSSTTFSSSSYGRLRPPSPQSSPPEPPAEPPRHVRDPHARQLPPPCFASFFLVVAAAEFISACNN